MDLVVLAIAGFIIFGMYKLLIKVADTDTETETVTSPSSLKKTELQSNMPEDATLRRHFLTNLKKEVEEELFPRPTCSTLKRHYDALVLAEVENRLFQ